MLGFQVEPPFLPKFFGFFTKGQYSYIVIVISYINSVFPFKIRMGRGTSHQPTPKKKQFRRGSMPADVDQMYNFISILKIGSCSLNCFLLSNILSVNGSVYH